MGAVSHPAYRRFLYAVSLWLLSALAQAQAAPDEATARALFEEGIALGEQGRWGEAEARFARSSRLLPTTSALLNLAVARYRLSRPVAGLDALRQFEQLPGLTEDDRVAAEQVRTELQALLAQLRLTVEPAHAALTVDGQPVPGTGAARTVPLDPGQHSLSIAAAGFVTQDSQFEAMAGQVVERNIALQASPVEAVKELAPPNASPPVAASIPLEQAPSGSAKTPRDDGHRRKLRAWLLAAAAVVVAGAAAGTVVALTRDDPSNRCSGASTDIMFGSCD